MGRASLPWKGSTRPGSAILWSVAVTPPCNGRDLLIDICLRLGSGVARNSTKVPWEWNFGMVDLFVVCLEGGRIDFGVVVAIDVVKSRRPW